MTAEVCVMNKLGVALAADSAVTRTGGADPKIYQSADKLFLLSYSDPVAVMIYGNATLMGIPWETIIKLYRRTHGDQSRPRVLDHALGLMSFLAKSRELFPEDLQRKYLVADLRAYFRHLLEQLAKTFEEEFAEKRRVAEARVKANFMKVVREESKQYRTRNILDGLPRTHAATVRKLFRRDIAKTVDAVLGKLPMTKAVRDRLCTLAAESAVKGFVSDYSGIVVAGFGNREAFPAIVSLEVYRVLAHRTKYGKKSLTQIEHDKGAIIVPFAQTEMVQAFMEGIDPRLRDFVQRSLSTTFEDLPKKLADTLRTGLKSQESLRKTLRSLTTNALATLREDWLKHQHKHHIRPIMQVVSILPKDELASLAESLVNLTVLRRHTSTEAETVGGPIDVAVVTKGDGFVWIKRKHYFDAGLNPRYIVKLGAGETLWHGKRPSNRSMRS